MIDIRSEACVEAVAFVIHKDNCPLTNCSEICTPSNLGEYYYDKARTAIEAMLGQLQMSEEEAENRGRDCWSETPWGTTPEHASFTVGYMEALRDLGLVRDNE